MKWRIFTIALAVSLQFSAQGEVTAGYSLDLGDGNAIELFHQAQIWAVYTLGARDDAGVEVDDRLDLYLRRARIGTKGMLYEVLSYQVGFAYDNIGKDQFTASSGTTQGSSNQAFHLWDAYFTWHLQPSWVKITIGYFRPQVGRESITTAFNVDSFTKALNNFYLREHIVGRSSGRETGINLGGLYHSGCWGLHYNLGIFDTNHPAIAGEDLGGTQWAPLIAGRMALSLGDPEMSDYSLAYRTNYYGKRTGFTVTFNGTIQGETNQTMDGGGGYSGGFRKNQLLGFDLLLNWKALCVMGEMDWLTREFSDDYAIAANLPGDNYTDQVYYLRGGWTFELPGGDYLEPVIMYTEFIGDDQSAVYPQGRHSLWEFGLNLFLKENRLKINLHYALQNGEKTSKFSMGEAEKGDFVGLGVQFVF